MSLQVLMFCPAGKLATAGSPRQVTRWQEALEADLMPVGKASGDWSVANHPPFRRRLKDDNSAFTSELAAVIF